MAVGYTRMVQTVLVSACLSPPLLAETAEVGPRGVMLAGAWLRAGSVVYVGDRPVSPHFGPLVLVLHGRILAMTKTTFVT